MNKTELYNTAKRILKVIIHELISGAKWLYNELKPRLPHKCQICGNPIKPQYALCYYCWTNRDQALETWKPNLRQNPHIGETK